VPEDLRDEIAPKNIIMIGPTGVGKRRSRAASRSSPERRSSRSKPRSSPRSATSAATFESIIRDLVELGIGIVKAEEKDKVERRAREVAEERSSTCSCRRPPTNPSTPAEVAGAESASSARDKLRRMLREGRLDERLVELE